MNTQLMADFDARSDQEQEDYLIELADINNKIKAVNKKVIAGDNNRLDPKTNYKLIYR